MAKILLIEEDKELAEKIRHKLLLDHITHELRLRQALKRLRSEDFDYLLIDFSGMHPSKIKEITTAIRQINATIPINILTDRFLEDLKDLKEMTQVVGTSVIPAKSIEDTFNFKVSVDTANQNARNALEKHEESKKTKVKNDQLTSKNKDLEWEIEFQRRKLVLVEKISISILVIIVFVIILEIVARFLKIETLLLQEAILSLIGVITVVMTQLSGGAPKILEKTKVKKLLDLKDKDKDE